MKGKKFGEKFGVGKRGDFKWDIVIVLLLGLVVVGLVLYFIFGEYFEQEDVDWEVCRQSIVLRNSMPELVWPADFRTDSFKDKFPLKCKTDVVTIDYKDVERAQREISETMVSCWFLFGNGEYNIFPGASWSTGTNCVYCARIHIAPSVKGYYVGKNTINIDNGLDELEFRNGLTYYQYLRNIGNQNPFQLITGGWHNERLTFGSEVRKILGSDTVWALPIGVSDTFDIDRGDLFILYHTFLPRGDANNINSLIFFQEKGADYGGKPFDSAINALAWNKGNVILEDRWVNNPDADAFCESFDGIPA